MAQPTINILTVDPDQITWEATVNNNFDALQAAFQNNPLIVHVVASKATLPAVAASESTLCLVKGDSSAYNDGLYHSDGTTWRQLARLDAEGDGQLLTSHDGEIVGKLRRRSNTATNQCVLEFALNDSGSAEQVYARCGAEIVTNTAASEDGDFIVETVDGGGLTEAVRVKGVEGHARAVVGSLGTGGLTLTNANALGDKQDGDRIWITDGRKDGEGAAAGTGIPAYYDTTAAGWRKFTDDTAVLT